MNEAALRDRVEYLEAENAELRRRLRLDPEDDFVMKARERLGLTRKQAGLLWALWPCRQMSRDQIYDVVWAMDPDGPMEKIIDVTMSRVRATLRPIDAKVQTIWGVGYQLLPADRAKIAAHIGIEVQP